MVFTGCVASSKGATLTCPWLLAVTIVVFKRVSCHDTTTAVSSCQLWLDGADSSVQFTDAAGTTPVTKGTQALIKFWRDKSTKGNHVITWDVNNPTQMYFAVVFFFVGHWKYPSLINGRDAIANLPGAGVGMFFQNSRRPLSGKTAFTSFTVLIGQNVANNLCPLQAQSGDINWLLESGNTYECLGSPLGVRLKLTPSLVSKGLCVYSVRGSAASGTTTLSINGVDMQSGTFGTTAFTDYDLNIGYYGGWRFCGSLGEILLFDTHLTEATTPTFSGVVSFLKQKWSI